jgi:DNA-binding SARP family transcriptional activator/Flp pilus assembly protein TadD
MSVQVEFCLLGPLIVRVNGALVPIPRGKQTALLAALLLQSGQTVTSPQLADLLWSPVPPPSSAITLQNYVKRLRQALGVPVRDRIKTRPGGYLIEVGPGELDVRSMEADLAGARRAAREAAWLTAAELSAAALAHWRGEPLSGVELGPLAVIQEIQRLAEIRTQAHELRIEADLHLGRDAEVIAELRQAVVTTPLREHLHALLMQALYRCGRRAEALEAYRQARRLLIDELGSEPGPELRALHQKILADDPALLPSSTAGGRGHVAAHAAELPVPRQLPASVSAFVGRTAELAELERLVARPDAPSAVLISAIAGTAGVGKTALALKGAHQVAQRFPDGQLYVNLRGYDPGRPVSAAEALAGFLRGLGVPGQDIPPGLDDRAARYRSLLAGRRILVVLDNAGDVEQVRPLLPGTAGCVTLVTSRDALVGLVAREGAHRLDLGLLPLADAVSLLRRLIGRRVDAEPDAAVALAVSCGRLPLVLRVAAELARARPAKSLAGLAAELADQQRRLDLLDVAGDSRTAARAVFSWSYRHLDPGTARAFRVVGDHPGSAFDARALAALADVSEPQATHLLRQLSQAYLVLPAGPGRYSAHDLLGTYGRELAASHDGDAARRDAVTRLIDYYLSASAAAMDVLFPAERESRPRFPRPAIAVPPGNPAAARAWLDTERANLLAIATLAADGGWPEQAADLAATLHRYLDKAGHYPEAVIIHDAARRAARGSGNPAGEATALVNLATIDGHQGRYDQAATLLATALPLFRAVGDVNGEARVLGNLGVVEYYLGRHGKADVLLGQAADLHHQEGDLVSEGRMLGNLATMNLVHGHYQKAKEYLDRGLAICRQTGNVTGEARLLGALGEACLRSGQYPDALRHLEQAEVLARQEGDRAELARILNELGLARLRLGVPERAVTDLSEALELAGQLGERSIMVYARSSMGAVLLATGNPRGALRAATEALDLASQVRELRGMASAHEVIAEAHQAVGEAGQAALHWQEALRVYRDLELPEADDVAAKLAGAGSGAQAGP